MAKIQLPNGWRPRDYQLKAWTYLENGGKHAELIWHRRSGKDEIALHRTACAAFERQATYWHMLPEAAQARKAIWEAINPHSGKRRIDEAFPHELRANTKDQEMMIRFVNGSTWQVIGSDNYNSLVGSPPAGVVFSEWALANPSARAYLRPIFAENNGWQMYITTPRGKNHAFKTYESGRKDPNTFAQKLSAYDTGSISIERLEIEKQAYIDDYGFDQGTSLFEQEYLCSFDAALMGAFYGREMREAEEQGRIKLVPYDTDYPVHTAWDLGFSDDTSIWFFQVIAGEIRILCYYGGSGLAMEDYVDVVKAKPYKYGLFWLPHDARAKTLASGGKSIQEMAWKAFGVPNVRIVPSLSVQDGIQAVRAMLRNCYFDEIQTESGVDGLKQYQREWDDDKKMFREKPRHDWASNPADAFRMLAIAWREEHKSHIEVVARYPQDRTISEIIARQSRRRREGE
jgi:hypothetical protein